MKKYTLARIATKTALILALTATAGCAQMEDFYDDMTGNDKTASAPKTTVKSPAAAPVQDVKTQDIDNSQAPAVELGSMRDSSLDTPPQTQSAAPQVVTTTTTTEIKTEAAPQVTSPAPAPTPANTVALLTIRFNQPHVSYDDALNNAVQLAEKTKPGVNYDVLSTVPDLTSLPLDQQQKLSARAKDNLRNVTVKMQQMGVTADRIRIAEQTLKVRSQEIQVFVR